MEENNNNYVLGIIGALVGALVASSLWVIFYVYFNMLWSLLALPIAFGALKGYELLKGKMDKKLPIIISVVSIVTITFVTLVVIPLLLLQHEGFTVSFTALKYLYEFDEFKSGIIHDYIFSLLFTILGISGVVRNIKDAVAEGREVNFKNISNNVMTIDANKKIKEQFVKNNAMSKDSAVDKDLILNDLEMDYKNRYFNALVSQQIIKKYKGKYYFSEKYEASFGRRFLLLYGKVMLFIICLVVLIMFIIAMF